MRLWVMLPTWGKWHQWLQVTPGWGISVEETRRNYREMGYCTALEKSK